MIIVITKNTYWNVWACLVPTDSPENESETFIIGSNLDKPEAIKQAERALNSALEELGKL